MNRVLVILSETPASTTPAVFDDADDAPRIFDGLRSKDRMTSSLRRRLTKLLGMVSDRFSVPWLTLSLGTKRLRWCPSASRDRRRQHGSFYRAARTIDIEQSTLSRAISNLERSIGMPIFERSRAGVKVRSERLGAAHASRTPALTSRCRNKLELAQTLD